MPLLDQRIIAGIGNAIRIEGLFRAGVSPWRAVDDLDARGGRARDPRERAGDEGLGEAGPPAAQHLSRHPRALSALRREDQLARPGRRQPDGLLVPELPGSEPPAAAGTSSPARRERIVASNNVSLLERVPLFAELSEDELDRIAAVAVPRSFPRGVRVFHEGDTSDACYIVRSGDLRVTREHSDGRAIALATLAARRHLRRARDAGRRRPLGERRDAGRLGASGAAGRRTCGGCSPSTPTSR